MLPRLFSQINYFPLNLYLRSASEKTPNHSKKTLPGFYRTTGHLFTPVTPAQLALELSRRRSALYPLFLLWKLHPQSHFTCSWRSPLCSVHLEGPLDLDQYCVHRPVVITSRGPQGKVMNNPACPSPVRGILHVLTDSGSFGEQPCLVSLFLWGLHINRLNTQGFNWVRAYVPDRLHRGNWNSDFDSV